MSRTVRLIAHSMVLALLATPVPSLSQSPDRTRPERVREPRPERQPRSTERTDPAGARPAASDPATTKRTWDFFKRLIVPRFSAGHGDCQPALAQFGKDLAGFNAYVDAGLAQPLDPKKTKAERAGALRRLESYGREIDGYLAGWEGAGKYGPDSPMAPEAADLCRVEHQRQNLRAIQAMLGAMARIWPDMAEIAPVRQKVDAALARIGDDRAIDRHVKANRRASLEGVRMKPAVASNPAWEGELRQAFGRLRPGETVLKLHLYSSSWYVKRHDLTGIPEYRQHGAWVASRRQDGTCRLYSLDNFQDFDGMGYGPSQFRLDGSEGREILCENV